MALRITIGLVLTVIAAAVAGRRLWWLYRLGTTGQPAPERIEAVRKHPGRDAETQATEVLGQRKLLQWTVPGVAHFLTFWGFIILLLTILEAYGDLFSKTFAIPGIGHWAFTGFIEDLFAVAVLAGIASFAVIRLRHNPKTEGRASRFAGSHTGAKRAAIAYSILSTCHLVGVHPTEYLSAVLPRLARGVVIARDIPTLMPLAWKTTRADA